MRYLQPDVQAAPRLEGPPEGAHGGEALFVQDLREEVHCGTQFECAHEDTHWRAPLQLHHLQKVVPPKVCLQFTFKEHPPKRKGAQEAEECPLFLLPRLPRQAARGRHVTIPHFPFSIFPQLFPSFSHCSGCSHVFTLGIYSDTVSSSGACHVAEGGHCLLVDPLSVLLCPYWECPC